MKRLMRAMQHILFVELLGGIGDVLIALPAIQALARSHPQASVTVLTFAPGGQLLETDPLIDRVIYAEKGKADHTVQQLLNTQPFNLIVSDTNYDRIDKIIQTSNAKQVVTNLWRSPPPEQFVSDRFLEILLAEKLITPESIKPPTLHPTLEEIQLAQAKLDNPNRPIVVLCPDAGMQIKRWSEQNFVRLGQVLQEKYEASIVVLVGSDAEQATRIVESIGERSRLWQPGSLRSLAAMLSQADVMIAPDTGPARIAAAVNVPTITLFGPSWHQRYGQPVPHINLQGYLNCSERRIENFTVQECWYSGECPFEWDTCVNEILVESVVSAVHKIIDKIVKEKLN
jgi:ADP-heptose:LPS heptosyltransferase